MTSQTVESQNAIDPSERQRLDDFLLRYAHTLDDEDVEAWPSFFHEQGLYQITTRANHEAGRPLGIMLCDSRGMMADRMLALRTANVFEPHTHCHMLSPAAYAKVSETQVNARSNFTVIRTMQDGRSELFAVGKYLDEISVAGDEPQFLSRRVVLESSRVDILIVFPI